ncbi:hypothetical protein D9758_004193 [Tetrapyrgos nigripes]|uniref:Chromatin modification-related protein n=1 Tax=Tetrapyrgos nigripes TaxID=182062 RepID=A0A8H5GUM3_9AGAR|nr:hypothetical protein D9758_004193 [Tetrapyrgos nigripes]
MEFASHILKRAATNQAGIFSGDNPAHYNANDPLRLWVIQVIVIMGMTQLLALIFARIRQPRVIAEVIGGVLLGPTVLGRIHANIGLVLFLFIIGLEIDTRLLKKNVKASASISVAGLIIPLGLGAALGEGIYREFVNQNNVNHGHFLLFTAVAVGITAFPVLCRILTEVKLLDTTVGVVTLAAGVGNDVVGWILLALTVALVNASSGLTALWVLLTTVGYVIFLLVPVRWAYHWLAKKTGSLESGMPSTFMMTITIVLVFFSAFFTDIIGVHAIFGLIIPHENGYAIRMVEKLEDLVTILLLPLYFALSGLRTNLGLLNNGITWGYTIIIILVAFVSKFFACFGTARLNGFNWRESGAIGSLMSCKGLVELIVLNVGLQAGVLDTRVFSMFVVHAIILTFMTTPLVLLFYPACYRVHPDNSATSPSLEDGKGAASEHDEDSEYVNDKYALVLDKIEQLPAAMAVTQLLTPTSSMSGASPATVSVSEKSSEENEKDSQEIPSYHNTVRPTPFVTPISLTLLRLIELTTRTSDVLKSQEASALIHNDPVTSVFRTFAYLVGGAAQKLRVKVGVNIVAWEDFDSVISRRVKDEGSRMVVIPWSRGNTPIATTSEEGSPSAGVWNPFDGVFQRHNSTSSHDQTTSSVVYSELVRKVFLTAPCDVALFVDRGMESDMNLMSGNVGPDTLLVLPFFGGPDDRLALRFLVKVCAGNEGVKAVVVKISKADGGDESSDEVEMQQAATAHTTIATADTVYGRHSTQTRLASDTADNLIWERYTFSSSTRSPALASALSRITFNSVRSSTPLQAAVNLITGSNVKGGRTVAIVGRSRRMAVESFEKELQTMGKTHNVTMGSSVAKTLGDVGAAMVVAGVDASLLIVQAHCIPPFTVCHDLLGILWIYEMFSGFLKIQASKNFEEAANLATEFIYSIENMPNEVRYFLEEIKYKDSRAQELQKQIDNDSARWIRHTLQGTASASETTPSTKKSTAHLPARIQQSYNEIEKLTNEKILLSQRIIDLISRTCARLDVDLKKVRQLQGENVSDSVSERDITPAPSIVAPTTSSLTAQDAAATISENLRHALIPSTPVSEPSHHPVIPTSTPTPVHTSVSVAPATKKRRTISGVAAPSIKLPPAQSRSVSPAATPAPPPKASQSTNHGRSRLARQVHPSPTKLPVKPAKPVVLESKVEPVKAEDLDDVEDDGRLYCFCQEPSHGDMIGCENEESCPYEWFHLGCVGLDKAPSDAWYCPVCREKKDDSKSQANKTKKGRKK